MGNSSSHKKSFKGQGHVLGGTGNASSQPKQSVGGSKGSTAAKARPPPKPKPKRANVTMTEEQRAAQRAQQQRAAEARGRQWDDRLSRNRQKRAAAKHEEIQEDAMAVGRQSHEVHDLGPMDPKLKSQLEADAAKLEQTGFDLYQPTFAASGNGRAVIAMQGGEGFADREKSDGSVAVARETADASKSTSTSSEVLAAQLEQAMENCNLDVLQNTIAFARANVKGSKAKEIEPVLQRAVELAAVLRQSVEGDQLTSFDMDTKVEMVSASLLQIRSLADVDKAAAIGALTVLKKLLNNFVSHPGEAKFQKVRLANKAIQTKLVQPAQGAALVILEACGFERQNSAEDQEDVLQVPGTMLASSAARSKIVLSHLERSIAALEGRS